MSADPASAGHVIVVDYDPEWVRQFEILREQLASALPSIIEAIEHVGSTAVPGLAAKPILDIDILLRSQTDLPTAIAGLERLGYAHQGDLGISGREAFRTPAGAFPHHLYVCAPTSREFRRHVAFRDYLRAHPTEAKAYADLKRELAATFGPRRVSYTEGKTVFITNILRRAGLET